MDLSNQSAIVTGGAFECVHPVSGPVVAGRELPPPFRFEDDREAYASLLQRPPRIRLVAGPSLTSLLV